MQYRIKIHPIWQKEDQAVTDPTIYEASSLLEAVKQWRWMIPGSKLDESPTAQNDDNQATFNVTDYEGNKFLFHVKRLEP